MSSRLSNAAKPKTNLQKLEGEIQLNRDSNKFREATRQLLVDSKQTVLAITINPSSGELMITGQSAIVHLIENKGFNTTTINDIQTAMIAENKKEDTDLVFSELYQNSSKDYTEDESVSRLAQLNHLNHNEWTAVDGRKAVGFYMADIRARNKNKYNKKEDKKASWLPDGVDKAYNSNMTLRDTTQVMQAIIDNFPEVRPHQNLPPIASTSMPTSHTKHTTIPTASMRRNVIYPTLTDLSDSEESDFETAIPPSPVPITYPKNKQKAKSSNKKRTATLDDSDDDDTKIRHSTPKKTAPTPRNIERNLRKIEPIDYSASHRCRSKHTREDNEGSNFGLQANPEKLKGASRTKRSNDACDSDKESVVEDESRLRSRKKTTNVATKAHSHHGSNKKCATHNAKHETEPQHKNAKRNNRKPNVDVAFHDEGVNEISDSNSTIELEERTRESRINRDTKPRRTKPAPRECNRRSERLRSGNVRSNYSEHASDVSSRNAKRISQKEGGGMHSDLRKKLFVGKGLQLKPKEGWPAWIQRLAKKPCNCCPENQ